MHRWREIDFLAKQFAIKFHCVALVVSWCCIWELRNIFSFTAHTNTSASLLQTRRFINLSQRWFSSCPWRFLVYLGTIGVGASKFSGMRRTFCPNFPKLFCVFRRTFLKFFVWPRKKFLWGKLSPHKFSVAVGRSMSTLTNSKTWRRSFFGGQKLFFREKSQTFLFSQIHWSLNRKQRCQKVCARIFGQVLHHYSEPPTSYGTGR